MECPIGMLTMHTACFAENSPCPNGWNTKKQLQLGNRGEPELPAPVTPPSGKQAQAEAIFQTFQSDYEKYQASLKELEEGDARVKYPQSPGAPGTTFGSVPLANLGTLPSTAEQSGFAVQYGKPRDADSIKLLTFPKPGRILEKWWDHALDSISSSSSYCTEAYRWALKVQKPETTFEVLVESGNFVRLDAILLETPISYVKRSKRRRLRSDRSMSEISQDVKSCPWCTDLSL